jgi:hypothetical protein
VTKDEFTSLPLQLALSIVWDVASQRLRDMPCPEVARAPKYDGRQRKDGGFVWYSEMCLDDLEFWQKKNAASAAEGGQYAEQNGKTARNLEKWVAWRRLFPTEQWRGTRGEEKATAAPPSKEPRVNQWEEKKNGATGKKPGGATGRGKAPPPEEDDGTSDFSF